MTGDRGLADPADLWLTVSSTTSATTTARWTRRRSRPPAIAFSLIARIGGSPRRTSRRRSRVGAGPGRAVVRCGAQEGRRRLGAAARGRRVAVLAARPLTATQLPGVVAGHRRRFVAPLQGSSSPGGYPVNSSGKAQAAPLSKTSRPWRSPIPPKRRLHRHQATGKRMSHGFNFKLRLRHRSGREREEWAAFVLEALDNESVLLASRRDQGQYLEPDRPRPRLFGSRIGRFL